MYKDNLTVIPVQVKTVHIERAKDYKFGCTCPFRRALNAHFGFRANCQLVFMLAQDITYRKEFPRFNWMICSPYGREILPDMYSHGHDKMEWWLQHKELSPFTYKFSVTETGKMLIKYWQSYWDIPERGFTQPKTKPLQ